MPKCEVNNQTKIYLPKDLSSLTIDLDTDYFYYDHDVNTVSFKLLSNNSYQVYFKQLYPFMIHEDELTNDMLDVIKSYTDSRTNRCYMKTNLNLLSGNLDDINWIYVNKLRSLLRGLVQSNLRHVYYRGLTLSDREIQDYIDRKKDYFYTTSFTSFTTDRLLIYVGNAIMILRTDSCNEKAKVNLANIWKWSHFVDEKEALLAVGSKLKILSVHYYGCKWEIEVELAEDDPESLE